MSYRTATVNTYQEAGERARFDQLGRVETLGEEDVVLVVLVMLERLLDELFEFFCKSTTHYCITLTLQLETAERPLAAYFSVVWSR